MGLIGAAVGAVGSIFGGISAAKAARRAKRMVEQQRKENQDWFDRRYNEDATQRADAQQILTQTQDIIRNRNQSAAGAAAVVGGTDESTAAAKEANNKALADATAMIAINGAQRKDSIEGQYRARDAQLNSQLQGIEQAKAKSIGDAVKGVADAASGMDFGDLAIGNKKIAL